MRNWYDLLCGQRRVDEDPGMDEGATMVFDKKTSIVVLLVLFGVLFLFLWMIYQIVLRSIPTVR